MSVRTEKVVLTADVGGFTSPMARAAASTSLVNRELADLDGSSIRTKSSLRLAEQSVDRFGSTSRKSSLDLDTFTGRLSALGTAALAIGPAAVPLTASLIPAVTGLASGMAGAAGAAAAAGLAFAGVGDALDALNDVQLDPTAENFAKLQQAMDDLGPAGANFVRYLDSIGGQIESLQRTAGANMFPGMQRGLEELVRLTPQADRLIAELSSRLGTLAADGGAALAGPEWESFFTFLETDAAPIFDQFARAAGNVALGLGNLMVAFAPLSRDFASGMLEASQSFAAWSADSGNFTDFIDYVRQVGPQVSDFLGSLAEAAVALTEAVAPWGSIVLPALTTLLDLFTAVAGSPIGPALATAALGMLALNKAAAASTAIMGRVGPAVGGARASLGQMGSDLKTVSGGWVLASSATERESKKMAAATGRLKGNLASIGKGGAALGAIGVAASGAAQGVGLQNAAMLGLAGTMAGPWGAAAGAGVGLILDFKAAQDQAAASASELASLLDAQTGALTKNYSAAVAAKMKPEDLSVLREAGVNVGDMTSALLEGGDAWSRFRAEMDASGLQESDWSLFGLGSSGGDVGEAIKNMDNLAVLVGASKDAFREQKPAVDAAAGSVFNAAQAAAELTAAQRAQNQATLASIDAGTRWGEAIANAAKQAQSGTEGFNHLTAAGRANRNAMSQLVGAYNAQGDAVKNSTKGYGAARERIAEFGHQMGLTRERIQQLQNSLDRPIRPKVDGKQAMQTADSIRERIGRIPKDPTSKAHLKDDASPSIAAILRGLQGLDGKTATTYVNTVHQQTFREIHERIGMADGGTIMGQRQPYGDKVLLWGAPGEEIITNRNGEADRFRADRAAGRIPAYADGGTIGLPAFASGGTVRRQDPVAATLFQSGHRVPDATLIANMLVPQIDRLGRAFDDLSGKRLGRLGRALEKATNLQEKQTEKARSRFEAVRDRRNQFGSSITDGLRGDLFADDGGSAFGKQFASGSIGAVNAQLRSERDRAQQFSKDIATLRKKGVNGAALEEIIASGDADRARMFASGSTSALRSYEAAFNARQSATAAAGRLGGQVLTPEFNALRIRLDQEIAQSRAIKLSIDALRKEQRQQHDGAQKSRKDNGAGPAARRGASGRR